MSKNQDPTGLFLILAIICWALSGYLAWNWINPKSFLSSIGFLIAWGIIGSILSYILQFIVVLIFANKK